MQDVNIYDKNMFYLGVIQYSYLSVLIRYRKVLIYFMAFFDSREHLYM